MLVKFQRSRALIHCQRACHLANFFELLSSVLRVPKFRQALRIPLASRLQESISVKPALFLSLSLSAFKIVIDILTRNAVSSNRHLSLHSPFLAGHLSSSLHSVAPTAPQSQLSSQVTYYIASCTNSSCGSEGQIGRSQDTASRQARHSVCGYGLRVESIRSAFP